MNYVAGGLAFVLFFIPCMFILYNFHMESRRIDREYAQRIKEIESRYK